ncbi:hypothetical protein LEP1GSC133_2890 [Leptospira borgpetersenii serovar Pomona str. 200901868]|uniref:Uncharacterized protein n=1 Tax=Leptospira borgpetersenii serovar Pomona str. 200901868 TaxID=1192866 RepID=M6WHP5_LEPBO|nr:hypothetical protein LEP1GSC133_2890 [Leptospira borgpetersenii serovar Pomona str. 200901868]
MILFDPVTSTWFPRGYFGAHSRVFANVVSHKIVTDPKLSAF